MTILYHEKQESALCGQHCLNNLLQGPYFNAGQLSEIALELDRKERALMMAEGMTPEAMAFLREGSGNVDEQGNFSIQVLSEAANRLFNVVFEDTRHEEVRPLMRDPAKSADGFVINRHAHWLCMRKLDGQWWKINSSEEMPERVSEFALSANLEQMTTEGWTVFIVKGKMPPQAPRSDGESRNWTDTSKPPPGSGWSVSGGNRAPEPPKFQAFTGTGQTLSGGSSGGGATAVGSEDDQLAKALALSKYEALKLRLEQRLPPEPETGAGASRVCVRLPDGSRAQRRFPNDASIQSLVDFTCVKLAQSGAGGTKQSFKLVSRSPALDVEFSAEAWADAKYAELTVASLNGAMIEVRAA